MCYDLSMGIKLIVGLGNVGERYCRTRHNVGFMVVDDLAEKWDLKWEGDRKFAVLRVQKKTENTEIILAKPQTMMNGSGKAVSSLAAYYKIDPADIYVVHDDLDISLGEYKIQKGKGPKEHKGLLSIYKELGTKDFWHVRTGVDNRDSESRIAGEDYVLMNFTGKELETFEIVKGKVVSELVKLMF